MRIAHITATFPPYQAGTGNVCYHNAQELVKLGHEVHVYTANMPGLPEKETINGMTVHRLKPIFQFGNAPFTPGLLGIKDFDILHLHHPFIFGAEMLWLVSKLHRIPYVLTHHNDLIGTGLRSYLFDVYATISSRMVFRGATKYVVVSKDHAAHCRMSTYFRRRWEDVFEIPNGVDVGVFHPGLDGCQVRQKYNIPAESSIVLFVGALDRAHHFKGVDILIDVFASLDASDAYLMIIGDGDLKETFEIGAQVSGVADRIIFPGALANDVISPYYAAADLLVLPSFPPESFGVVLVEALACGTPVVAHDIPGVRSVVNHGVDGYLVKPGNRDDLKRKLLLLLKMPPSQREQMGLAGRSKTLKAYSWDNIGKSLESIYRQVITSHTK